MRIRGFDLTRAQRGWTCEAHFMVFTSEQFTAEEHAVHSGGRWLLTALWNGWRAAKAEAKTIAAKPGEREALGW